MQEKGKECKRKVYAQEEVPGISDEHGASPVIGRGRSNKCGRPPCRHFVRVIQPSKCSHKRHRTQTGTLKRHTEIALQQNTHQRHVRTITSFRLATTTRDRVAEPGQLP